MIRTIPDMLNALAKALDEGDIGAVDMIEAEVSDWLQTDRERDAQLNMIESVRNAIQNAA